MAKSAPAHRVPPHKNSPMKSTKKNVKVPSKGEPPTPNTTTKGKGSYLFGKKAN